MNETEINAPGPSIDDQFQALLNQIKQTTKEDTVIVAVVYLRVFQVMRMLKLQK